MVTIARPDGVLRIEVNTSPELAAVTLPRTEGVLRLEIVEAEHADAPS